MSVEMKINWTHLTGLRGRRYLKKKKKINLTNEPGKFRVSQVNRNIRICISYKRSGTGCLKLLEENNLCVCMRNVCEMCQGM